MSDEMLVKHCSPTLAGMKTGNMFTCPYESEEEVLKALRRLNGIFRRKGLRAIPLRIQRGRALVYIFRPERLERDFRHSVAKRLLLERGYNAESVSGCIAMLMERLEKSEEFPHEIGLFLGYPPEDVDGFIEKRVCKCVGLWKVYTDEESAGRAFRKYKKCTQAYCDAFRDGKTIDKLTVAG